MGFLLVSSIIIVIYAAYTYYFKGIYRSRAEEKYQEYQAQGKSDIYYPSLKDYLLRQGHSLEGFNFSEFYQGQRIFTIEGEKIAAQSRAFGVFKTALVKNIVIEGAKVTFYEKNRPVSYIISKKAVIDARFKKDRNAQTLAGAVDFFENIAVITKDKRVLTCDNLRWDNIKKRIFAKGNCVLIIEGKETEGDYVDSDVKLRDFSLKKDKAKRIKALAEILR